MSIHAIAWAQQVQAPLTSNEAFVLVTLAEYANDDGTHCWPAMSTVARKCRMSRVTVLRILERLEYKHGVIVKERSGQRGGKTNHYRLLVNKPMHLPPAVSEGSQLDPYVQPLELQRRFEALEEGERLAQVVELPGVYHGDTPAVVDNPAGGVSAGYTQGVSPRDRGVAPDATGGVAPGATQPVNTHQYPSRRSSACSTAPHVVDGELVDCGVDVPLCMRFAITEDEAARGRAHLAALRAQLKAPSGTSPLQPAPNAEAAP